MSKDWIKGRGQESLESDAKDNSSSADFGPQRFWMKPETSTQIVFCDDDPLRFYEHQIAIFNPKTGKMDFRNWGTCPGAETCPMCKEGDEPAFVAAWSVLDRTEFTYKHGEKAGQTSKDNLRLFVAKPKVMTKLARRSKKAKAKGHTTGLTGLVFEVARGDGKSPNTGDDFELMGDGTKLLAGVKLPDYEAIFAPNMKRLQRFAAILKERREHGEDKKAEAPADSSKPEVDEIPF